jgi:hypothetical protein
MAIPSQAPRRPGPRPYQTGSGTASSLRLPSLPRFHPANFPSQNSSYASTPMSGPNSPQPPMSPRAHQRQYVEAQRQMLNYHRELLASGSRSHRSTPKPSSPRLCPTGSPGPVTPLELEDAGGYLAAGVTSNDAASRVDKLILEEAKRRGELSAQRTSAGGR